MTFRNYIMFFIIFGTINLVQGQGYDNFDKCIITKKFACTSNDNKGKKIIYLSGENINAGRDSVTSAFLKSGLYYGHPLAWDIVNDSLIFVVRMHEDNTGMTYTDLRKYNMEKMNKLSNNEYKNYVEDNKRIIVKNIPPLFTYSLRVAYQADTLKGPIYYDISCNRDSFFLFIYIKDTKTLEKWNFVHYPLYTEIPFTAPKEIQKEKAWNKVATYQIDLDSPFRIIQQKKNLYLITMNEESYRLEASNTSIKKTIIQKKDTEMIIIDKEKDEIRLAPVITPNQRSSMQRENLIRASKLIKLK